MRKQILLVILSVIATFIIMEFPDGELEGGGISLIKPPDTMLLVAGAPQTPYSPSGIDFGNPLDTQIVATIAYYYDSNGWNLSEVVPAFDSYTLHGNYIDGYITVEYPQEPVSVRVRADGWIMAFLNTSQSRGYLYASGSSGSFENPAAYETRLSKAIQEVYTTVGRTFVGHDAISYYDYGINADKMIMMGDKGTGYIDVYYTIPSGVTGVKLYYAVYYYNVVYLYIDGTQVGTGSGGSWHVGEITYSSWNTVDTQHEVYMGTSAGKKSTSYPYPGFCLIMFLSD